ncbi:MAG: sigma-70 family RNA polymerase sigma factor [Acidobacteriota bacterium]
MKLHRPRREETQFLEEALPHMESLYRVSLSMTRDAALAEDLVQETYKEAWKSFRRYTLGSNCKAWLFRILFRVWGKHLRCAYRVKQVDIEEVPESKLALESDVQQRIERQEVLKILRTLPEHYQKVLVLADLEGFRYREIAQMLELPIGTVMSRLNRARALFRQKFLQESEKSQSA